MQRMSKVVNVIVSATHNSVIVVGHGLDNVDGKRANGEPTDFFFYISHDDFNQPNSTYAKNNGLCNAFHSKNCI